MSRGLALLGVLALLAAPRTARPCSCRRPSIEVVPGPGAVAPTNTRVLVIVPLTQYWDLVAGTATTAAGKPPRLLLQARVPPPEGKRTSSLAAVEHDVVTGTAGALVWLELRPRAPLTPKTRHQVTVDFGDGRAEVVGEFTTGEAADTGAPAWGGLEKAAAVHRAPVCCNCSTGDTFVSAEPRMPSDDVLAAEELVYAVWTGPAGKPLDFTQPPATWVRPWAPAPGGVARLSLGHESACAPSNLDLPTTGKLRLGVVPVDLAGNRGGPAEVDVDLARPREE